MTAQNENGCLNLDEIETQIKFLSSYRGEQRQQRIKTTSLNLYRTLKSFGYKEVERSFLLTFFDGLKARTQQKTLKAILGFLIDEGKFKPSKKIKKCVRIQEKPLQSYFNKRGECITISPLSAVKSAFGYEVKSFKIV